jgi:AcrR family transcriptional regulator
MSRRCYHSPVRAAAAAEKRDAVVKAAIELLRKRSIAEFSLDSVAKAAAVTRLTVYNQFGSRRGLLEAVLDELAQHGRLLRLPEALEVQDPRVALSALVDIFCDFWAGDPAVAKLHDAAALDAEFGEALHARGELRRQLLKALVDRMGSGAATPPARREAVDLIFTLTGSAVHRSLSATQSDAAVRRILKAGCKAAVDRLDQ